jgi:hypothetical protein
MSGIPVMSLRVATSLERSGRRVQLVEGRAASIAGDTLLRAFAWPVRRTGELPLPPPVNLPPPESLPPFHQRLRENTDFFGHDADKRFLPARSSSPDEAGCGSGFEGR